METLTSMISISLSTITTNKKCNKMNLVNSKMKIEIPKLTMINYSTMILFFIWW